MYKYPNTYIAPSEIHGLGVFARKFIPKGEIIKQGREHYWVESKLVKTIRILKNKDYKKCMLNHSCTPNAGRNHNMYIIALRDIQPNEEICEDYGLVPLDGYGFMTPEILKSVQNRK
jgi:SET domain-containing protein